MLIRLAQWISTFIRRPSNRPVIDRLHGEIVAAARNPVLFSDFGIADTFEGRFEAVVVHAWLVLRRLRALPQPAPDAAQDLTDAVFRHFEAALRQMGVADATVPKRMKGLAEAFLGRSLVYDRALEKGAADLADALKRNVYNGSGDGEKLAAYVMSADAHLANSTLDSLLRGPVPFPNPLTLLTEAAP